MKIRGEQKELAEEATELSGVLVANQLKKFVKDELQCDADEFGDKRAVSGAKRQRRHRRNRVGDGRAGQS